MHARWLPLCLALACAPDAARAVAPMVGGGAETSPATVSSAFPPPEGATRRPADGFGEWLGTLPLRDAGLPVRTWDGRRVGHDARVVDLPLVKGDLQQCADSVLRLRAEWLRRQGAEVTFHATSGDPMPWARYRDGEEAWAAGNHLEWRRAEPASFERYLGALFTWAGTRSLAAHDTVPASSPAAGDVVVEPGSPGHAVILLDVAEQDHGPTGPRTLVLVGEGYMPAQDFHVELGPVGGWWEWRPESDVDGGGLRLDHWQFDARALRRWRTAESTSR